MSGQTQRTDEQKENLGEWVKLLRSGEYKQGRGKLHRILDGEDTYCCLGVACELAIAKGKPVSRISFPIYSNGGHYAYALANGSDVADYMPDELARDMFGLEKPSQRHLARLNDAGENFEKIATYIEKNYINE